MLTRLLLVCVAAASAGEGRGEERRGQEEPRAPLCGQEAAWTGMEWLQKYVVL